MREVRKGLWLSEERIEQSRRNYLSSKKSIFQWFKSLFKGKSEEIPKLKS